MFDIWSSVAQLHQPCLYRPISGRLLTPDGIVRKEILASVDRLMCEELASQRASFQAPQAPAPLRQGQRYLNTSAMQKAIRRGDVDLAMTCAQRGCMDDPDYTFRRLATCAVEDVGLGNLLAVGMTLAVLGNKQMRACGATDELAAYLAYLLAISPKSRLACDLLSIADYDPALRQRRLDLAGASEPKLAEVAKDRSASPAERMIAGWFLAGTSRFRGANMPKVARHRSSFVKLIARARMPLVLYYLADRTAARLSDAMSISWWLIAEMVDDAPKMQITSVDLPASHTISGFPAYTYDLHTAEGRAALNRFSRHCEPIAGSLADVPPHRRDMAVRHAIFLVEGGLLHQRLDFQSAAGVERQAHWSELACCGLPYTAQHHSLLAACRTNMPTLNAMRADETLTSDCRAL